MFKSIGEAVKSLGEAQALKDLNSGVKQRQYRKDRNMKNQELLEMVKGNSEVQKAIEAAMKKKVG